MFHFTHYVYLISKFYSHVVIQIYAILIIISVIHNIFEDIAYFYETWEISFTESLFYQNFDASKRL